ncbi:hypothetical protein HMPREF0083_01149 [Aneurinibacillus aneurinilyticus ATCC 12856]|uniref:Uncharacterized protein n=1 Tax=Aneurinibacillus aneurinilyticus ATCC 12856 TaxID=649747 RepID=U1YIY0_ANEAE|nr:hypothetical protein HMPREF0083_01149 [Aneurinibacillus aneurinilyticus ATCC 12856]
MFINWFSHAQEVFIYQAGCLYKSRHKGQIVVRKITCKVMMI